LNWLATRRRVVGGATT